MSFHILHLTDSHLFADSQQTLMGVATQDSFTSVIAHARAAHMRPDLILLTGDISQDNTLESYQYCLEQIKTFEVPMLWVPGNHDTVEYMADLTTQALSTQPAQVYTQGLWHIIALNTQVPGRIEGGLTHEQLAFIAQTIKAHPDNYFVIAMHHHPGAINCAWVDQNNLKNDAALFNVLQHAKHKPTIICGHVHQDTTQKLKQATVLSTPSTCFQFKPNTAQFSLDSAMPGYRWLKLDDDGTLTTHVTRIEEYALTLDTTSVGY